MARRIEIELTSARDDGTWTWRAAGAKEPKGVVEASLLPGSVATGDVLRVEVEVGLDGTEITQVFPPKGARKEPELLELIGRDLRDDELVTSKLVGKRGRRDRDDDDRRGGGRGRGRDGRGGDRGRGGEGRGGERGRGGESRDGRRNERGDRSRGPRDGERRGGPGDRGPHREGGGGPGRERTERPRRPRPDDKPRPKRLRAQRVHRRAVLDTLEAHERPIADEVLRGGIPAVRQAVEKQNAQARAEGRPEVDPTQLEALAERLLPRLRAAEWRDRADAALADLDELDLRDLRTVVVAADSAARDEESRALATQLREGLERRIEADHAAWLAEMGQLLDDGRVVRALRVSSRPPKAGVPLPPELATRLAEAATASLTADTFDDRWATVLDALSLSPVHARVAPASVPAEPSDELKTTVAGFGSRVPLVAQALGVEPTAAPRRPRRGGPARGKASGGGGGRPGAPKPPAPKAETPAPPAAAEPEAPVEAPAPTEPEAAVEAPEAVVAEVPEAAPAPEAPSETDSAAEPTTTDAPEVETGPEPAPATEAEAVPSAPTATEAEETVVAAAPEAAPAPEAPAEPTPEPAAVEAGPEPVEAAPEGDSPAT